MTGLCENGPAMRMTPLLLALSLGPTARGGVVPAEARQMPVVVREGWAGRQSSVRAFERAASGGWKPAWGVVPVSLGRTGLAWGLGLHGKGRPAGAEGGALKHEGD